MLQNTVTEGLGRQDPGDRVSVGPTVILIDRVLSLTSPITPSPCISRKHAQQQHLTFGITLVIHAAAGTRLPLKVKRISELGMNKAKRIRTKAGWRWLTALSLSLSLLTGIVVSEGAKAQSNDRQRRSTNDSLSKYASDLTAAAEQGRFSSVEDRTKDTERAIEILAGHHKNNPVVISDSQAIRDMVVIGVAVRIAHGNVPEELMGTRLYKLNLDALFHDAKTADDLTNRVSAILAGVT